jgi:hypothetical protein
LIELLIEYSAAESRAAKPTVKLLLVCFSGVCRKAITAYYEEMKNSTGGFQTGRRQHQTRLSRTVSFVRMNRLGKTLIVNKIRFRA